jgi:hypothetical protein
MATITLPRPPGTSPDGSPISKLMGPPPLRRIRMVAITARAAFPGEEMKTKKGDMYLRYVSPFLNKTPSRYLSES